MHMETTNRASSTPSISNSEANLPEKEHDSLDSEPEQGTDEEEGVRTPTTPIQCSNDESPSDSPVQCTTEDVKDHDNEVHVALESGVNDISELDIPTMSIPVPPIEHAVEPMLFTLNKDIVAPKCDDENYMTSSSLDQGTKDAASWVIPVSTPRVSEEQSSVEGHDFDDDGITSDRPPKYDGKIKSVPSYVMEPNAFSLDEQYKSPVEGHDFDDDDGITSPKSDGKIKYFMEPNAYEQYKKCGYIVQLTPDTGQPRPARCRKP